MTEALRHKIERFDRFQRQFARTRHRRSRDEFARNLAELVERAQSGSRRRPAPAPPVDTPTDPERAAFDQQVRDLLVRVHGRAPVPSAPDLPGSGHGDWWSPTPVYGFRVWQMIQGEMVGARVSWHEPRLSAVCLHPQTDPATPLPHDAADCGRPPCGIYATKTTHPIRRLIEPWFEERSTTVGIGVVALTGRVIEHDRGYRAQHATVAAMAVLTGGTEIGTVTWAEEHDALTRLFADPETYLFTERYHAGPIGDSLDRAFERVASLAKRLAERRA